MKVTVEKVQTLIELREVPLGSCVRLASRADDEIYMCVASTVSSTFAWVRLNDGELFDAKGLSGYHWELVDAEVVVHG